jgi:SAM-dependent methyltransferase
MTYSTEFFKNRREQTLASARPIVEHLWKAIKPETVLDVGCATGIWLAEAQKKGALNVRGIDGPWVPREELEIEDAYFLEHDLSQNNPSDVGYYDLAFCIEVAEHLAPNAADRLINFLTSHADAVLFSAAIPGQGGTGHVNEQPQSYWHKKFRDRKFECFDVVRPDFWDDPIINVIYKQNMLLYVRAKGVFHDALLEGQFASSEVATNFSLDRIHPYLFKLRIAPKKTIIQRIQRKLESLSTIFPSRGLK